MEIFDNELHVWNMMLILVTELVLIRGIVVSDVQPLNMLLILVTELVLIRGIVANE